MRPFSLEMFLQAIETGELNRAAQIASVMHGSLKTVAREIWLQWVDVAPSF